MEHLKAPADYTFVAARFYGPDERYSNGSGLSMSALTLERAKAYFDTYKTGGHTYCLVVMGPGGEVLHHKGPSLADTTRSMMRAYKRRNDPMPFLDEASIPVRKSRSKVAEVFPDTKALGVTAVPERIRYAHTSETFQALIQDNADVVLFVGNTRITITPKAGKIQSEHAGVIARALNLSAASVTVETLTP